MIGGLSPFLEETLRVETPVQWTQRVALEDAELSGVPIPAGLKTELQRMDVVSVVGLKSAVNELAEVWGMIARTNSATDLLTLSTGMILGLLIGLVAPAFEGPG